MELLLIWMANFLSAEMGNMLQISYVGYISQEIKVESNKLLRIIMEEDTKSWKK